MAQRIKLLRQKRKLTQESVAEKLGLTHNAYVKLENAYNAPSLKVLIRLSQLFDVPIDMIVFGSINRAKSTATNHEMIESIIDVTDVDKLKHTVDFLQKTIMLIEDSGNNDSQ